MSASDVISYSAVEIHSVLPLGWSLEPGSERWDEARATWEATVRDGSDLTWPVRVSLDDVRQSGRLEALRQATQKTKRQCFG